MKLEDYDRVPLIQSAAIELTNHCQLRCSMCWSQSPRLYPPRPKGYMDYDLFTSLIDELAPFAKHGHMSLSLSYAGESLLHPRFGDYLAYVAEKKKRDAAFNLRLYTNGLLLDRHAEDLIQNRVAVCVGIHNPPSPALVRNIQHYTSVRYELLPTYGHLVAPVAGALVFEEFGGVDGTRKIYDEYVPLLDNMSCYHMYTEDLQRTDDVRPEPCREPFYYLSVLWNGDVLPCCHILSSGCFTMGNVGGGLLPVWMGERYARLRAGDVRGTPCSRCGIQRGILGQTSRLTR